MHPHPEKEWPVRAGVFSNAREVEEVVQALLKEGFSQEEITVVCSDEAQKLHFREFMHQDPAGAHLPAAAAVGGAAGAALGGVTTAAIGLATGVLPVMIIGGAGLMTGGVVGSLLGAYLTRGAEKEAADFYDQAVQEGKLLVVVDKNNAPDAAKMLPVAEEVFSARGVRPLPLPEG